jgi:hypothetical protein
LVAFVQHLLNRGLGIAGVAIDLAPTQGVPLGFKAISDSPVLLLVEQPQLSVLFGRHYRSNARTPSQSGPGCSITDILHRRVQRQA